MSIWNDPLTSPTENAWSEATELWSTNPTEQWVFNSAERWADFPTVTWDEIYEQGITFAVSTPAMVIVPEGESTRNAGEGGFTPADSTATDVDAFAESISDFLWSEDSQQWSDLATETWQVGESNQLYLTEA